MNTPTPDQLQKLPKWAQSYIAWLRERVAAVEAELQDRKAFINLLVERDLKEM